MCDFGSNQNVSTYKECCQNRKHLQLAPFPPIACDGKISFHVGPSIIGLFAVFYQYVLVVCGQYIHFHLLSHLLNTIALKWRREVYNKTYCMTSRLSFCAKAFGPERVTPIRRPIAYICEPRQCPTVLKLEWRAPFVKPSYRIGSSPRSMHLQCPRYLLPELRVQYAHPLKAFDQSLRVWLQVHLSRGRL
jgi:hypothetical protein